jgi:two-component sensor histidine kinase
MGAQIATESSLPDGGLAEAQQEVARLRRELQAAQDRLEEMRHVIRDASQIALGVVSIVAVRRNSAEARLMAKDVRVRLGAIGVVVSSAQDGAVQLSGCVEKIAREVASIHGRQRIGLRLDIAPVMAHERAAVSVALIAVELLVNAYQHGFPERPFGSIEVTLRPLSDVQAILRIADNGIGVPPAIAANWPALVPGRDHAGLPTALGLARNLGGTLGLRSGGGTTFELVFPMRS